jgi:hypothetical protein
MKRLLWAVGVLAVLPLAWIGVAGWLAEHEARDPGRRWAETALSVDEAAARFPRTTTSTAARELEAAARRMGIAFGRSAAPSKADEAAFHEIARYVDAETQRDDDVANAPPAPAAVFLRAHALELGELRAAAQGELYWECDIAQLGLARPNVYDLFTEYPLLQNLLAADALARLHAGDVAGAVASIDAGWRVNTALKARPETMAQTFAIAAEGLFLGVLRKVPSPPPEWSGRVRAQDPRHAMLLSVQVDAWTFSALARRNDAATWRAAMGPSTITGPGVGFLTDHIQRPYLRLAAASYAKTVRRLAEDMKAVDICAIDKHAYDRILKAHSSRWNVFAPYMIRSTVMSLLRSGRRALDAELTQQVLDRGGLQGTGSRPSSVCPAVDWTYRVAGDEVSIAASRDPFAGTAAGLPLRFVGHRSGPTR